MVGGLTAPYQSGPGMAMACKAKAAMGGRV